MEEEVVIRRFHWVQVIRGSIDCREFKLKFSFLSFLFFLDHHAQAILSDVRDKIPLTTGEGHSCWLPSILRCCFLLYISFTSVLVVEAVLNIHNLLLNLRK